MNANQTGRYTVNYNHVPLQLLFDAANESDIDAALRPIQDAAGITTGDRAGMYFSGTLGDAWGTFNQKQRLETLVSYLAYEKAASDINTLATQAGQPAPEIVTISSAQVQSAKYDLSRHFVAYSANESALSEDGMFWSNDKGWTELASATVFPAEEIDSVELPIATGNDATWMTLEEAYHGKLHLLQQDKDQVVMVLDLSDTENDALSYIVGTFVDNEQAKGNVGIGRELIDYMIKIEGKLMGGAKALELNLIQLALVQRALMIQADGRVDETQEVSGWDNAIASIIHRIGEKLAELHASKYLNTYTLQFQCRCPVNSKVIHYYLVIESKTMIPVEEITELAASQTECFHEPMAEMFFKRFPNTRQRLSAYHHGTHIKTVRSE